MSLVVELAKEHIAKMDPNVQEVDVRMERSPEGEFVAKIHVRLKDRVLHAVKKSASYRESLDRSCHAILKQMQKIKAKRLKRRNRPGLEDLVFAQAS